MFALNASTELHFHFSIAQQTWSKCMKRKTAIFIAAREKYPSTFSVIRRRALASKKSKFLILSQSLMFVTRKRLPVRGEAFHSVIHHYFPLLHRHARQAYLLKDCTSFESSRNKNYQRKKKKKMFWLRFC